MLAGGGQLGGVRILSEETVRKACEVQNNQRDRIIVMTMQWRLGYHKTPILSRQLRAKIQSEVEVPTLSETGRSFAVSRKDYGGEAARSALGGGQ